MIFIIKCTRNNFYYKNALKTIFIGILSNAFLCIREYFLNKNSFEMKIKRPSYLLRVLNP